MSAGDFQDSFYETDNGDIVPIRIQPETASLILNAVTNASAVGPPAPGFPTAKVSGGRREFGINARLVRLRFTGTLPPGYSGGKSIITLPVMLSSVWAGYGKGQTGTYTLNGTAYDVIFVGKTGEALK